MTNKSNCNTYDKELTYFNKECIQTKNKKVKLT